MYIKPIKIGNVEISNNIFLAPMAGVTDMPFRRLCKEFGAGMIYTEMASSKAVHYGSEKTKGIYEVFEDERPIGIQIFGSDPDVMAETASELSEYADIIDIILEIIPKYSFDKNIMNFNYYSNRRHICGLIVATQC